MSKQLRIKGDPPPPLQKRNPRAHARKAPFFVRTDSNVFGSEITAVRTRLRASQNSNAADI